ncbi:unnamed protein product [Aphanomyces euteiches]|nr:hypothetical protein AeRB84_004073 [Aphanomyces euteiches]
MDNLRQFGVNDKTLSVHHYEVVVGDPTYMILSDPFVSLVMVVDVWLGVAYAAMATIRAGQVSDLWLLLLGMLYSSRYVWFAYFVMRILSFVAKRQHCEDRFSPLDPTLLAMVAYLYGGPVMSVFDNTRLMAIFHPLWSLFVPASMKYQAIDGVTTTFKLFPILKLNSSDRYAIAFDDLCSVATGGKNLQDPAPRWNPCASRWYNDVKTRILFAWQHHKFHCPPNMCLGGSLYDLYETSPKYRSLPLFSHRAADCFVLCFDHDNKLICQVRLSLLACIDTLEKDPQRAIQLCKAHHATSYGTWSALCTQCTNNTCHLGANKTPWIE